MSQLDTIEKIDSPRTIESLVRDLRQLGLKPGMNVIVHSSLSSIGWVSGGASAVVMALMEVITENGTLMMPTHSSGYSEPSYWQNPPVPESWWKEIRSTMPAFSTSTTPSEHMGAIPEVFRKFSNVLRSYHPATSFASWGKNAKRYTEGFQLEFAMSDLSPLGKLYEDDGYILLLGVEHSSNTSLHLAETRIEGFPTEIQGGPVIENNKRVWKEYEDYKYDSEDFDVIGSRFEESNEVNCGKIGSSKSKLISMRKLVDFALLWMKENRKN